MSDEHTLPTGLTVGGVRFNRGVKLSAVQDALDRHHQRLNNAEVENAKLGARLSEAKEALFPKPRCDTDGHSVSAHSYYNLLGALDDLEQEGADAVSLKTIRRVCAQLADAEAALSPDSEKKDD